MVSTELDLIHSEQARDQIATRTDALAQVDGYESSEWATIKQAAEGLRTPVRTIQKSVETMQDELLRAGLRRAMRGEFAYRSGSKNPWMLNEECVLRIGVTLRGEAGQIIRDYLMGLHRSAPVAVKKAAAAAAGLGLDANQLTLAVLDRGLRGWREIDGGVEFMRFEETARPTVAPTARSPKRSGKRPDGTSTATEVAAALRLNGHPEVTVGDVTLAAREARLMCPDSTCATEYAITNNYMKNYVGIGRNGKPYEAGVFTETGAREIISRMNLDDQVDPWAPR